MVTNSVEEAENRISEIREAYEEAEKTGEFSPVAPYVVDDLVVMPPGHPPIVGKSEWEAVFNDAMADAPDRNYHIEYSSDEVLISDELAVDRGTAIDTAEDNGEETLRRGYNYVWVYRWEPEASWQLAQLIWNSNE